MIDRLPHVLLRLEGVALGPGALALYVDGGYSWLLFALLGLAPDLAAVGYAAGPRIGAVAYDLAHVEAWPVALGVVGALAASDGAIAVALVWLLHIGFDRALGYGLKYPTAFKETHLQRV